MRVVIDANVFISALIGNEAGAPHRAIQAFSEDEIDVVVSPQLLAELDGVLARRTFAERVTQEERTEYVTRIRDQAELVADPEPATGVVRDPKDAYIVALALATGADAIVSGDRDLLEAGLDAPRVVTPRQLIDLLQRTKE